MFVASCVFNITFILLNDQLCQCELTKLDLLLAANEHSNQ